jgi:hypothetical protein
MKIFITMFSSLISPYYNHIKTPAEIIIYTLYIMSYVI